MYKFKKKGESDLSLIKRFSQAVRQEGILEEAKRDYFFENNQERRKRKLKERQKEQKKLHF